MTARRAPIAELPDWPRMLSRDEAADESYGRGGQKAQTETLEAVRTHVVPSAAAAGSGRQS